MKRTALLIGLVFAVSVAVGGDLAQLEMVAGGDPVEGWWLLRFFEGTEHEREYEIQRPLNDWMSGYRNRRPAPDISTPTRTELAVTPSDPTAGEPVYLQVSCWMPASNYVVDEADLTIQGHQITVTLNWVCQGIGFQAFNWRKHTQYLGMFDPGLYVVRVTNKGEAGGNATTSFRVSAPASTP